MTYGSAESILTNADAYRTTARLMTRIAVVAMSVAVVAVGIATYSLTNRPEPRYFATTTDGQIQPLVPLDRPHLSANAVTNFAVQAVTQSLTYDFANYRDDFQRSMQWFTKPTGWNSFVQAVQSSGTLDLVQRRKFNTTAVAENAVIVREGVQSGKYTWVIQIPINVTYQSASQVTSQKLLVSVLIQRLQTYESPYAVAIEQFVAAPR